MKSKLYPALITISFLSIGVAGASDICDVPKAEWQPQEALQTKLVEQGWTVKKIKVDDGCYEAYATNELGERVEAYFDPKTFDLIKSK